MTNSAELKSILRVVVVTGMSGAGRSTAAHALEDQGWFVIDNLPAPLLPDTINQIKQMGEIPKLAVVLDARGKSFFREFPRIYQNLSNEFVDIRTLFLEASDDSLVRRLESSRRPHPLQNDGRILDGLIRERKIMEDLRIRADVVLDTTNLNVHDLRRRVEAIFTDPNSEIMHVTVLSFGFKYGVPTDADLVFDVRFLPNPYWDENLRDLTGIDFRSGRCCSRLKRCARIHRINGQARAIVRQRLFA